MAETLFFNGVMTEVRLTKGQARYNNSGGFPVPQSPHARWFTATAVPGFGLTTNVGTATVEISEPALYHAGAVHFGTYLRNASLVAAGDSSGYFSASMWLKLAASSGQIWTVDPEGNYTSNQYLQFGTNNRTQVYLTNDAFSSNIQSNTTIADIPVGSWFNMLVCASTNHAAGLKTCKIYVNDVLTSTVLSDVGAAFLMTFNGKPFWVGDDGYSNPVDGDMADLWFAPGQFIDFSVEINRRKFIDTDGKPVYLGTDGAIPTGTAPAVFFSGDASEFATNRGTGGAFTLTGSLTTATTSPSGPAASIYSTVSHDTGKHYVEVTFTGTDPDFQIGVWNAAGSTGAMLDEDGYVRTDAGTFATFDPLVAGDVVGMAVDVDAGKIWFRVNGGDWNNDPAQAPE